MIEWKECENEVEEMSTLHDHTTLLALHNYGLLTFFKTHSMR